MAKSSRAPLDLNLDPPGSASRAANKPTAVRQTPKQLGSSRQDRIGKRLVATYVPEAVWLSLRQLALSEARTSNDLLAEFIEDGLAKYGRKLGV
jgi:hypothetical protein